MRTVTCDQCGAVITASSPNRVSVDYSITNAQGEIKTGYRDFDSLDHLKQYLDANFPNAGGGV